MPSPESSVEFNSQRVPKYHFHSLSRTFTFFRPVLHLPAALSGMFPICVRARARPLNSLDDDNLYPRVCAFLNNIIRVCFIRVRHARRGNRKKSRIFIILCIFGTAIFIMFFSIKAFTSKYITKKKKINLTKTTGFYRVLP